MTISSFLALLKARKWTVIVTLVVALAATTYSSVRAVPLYTASSRVLVKIIPTETNPTVPQLVNLETEREIAASVPVAKRVARDLGDDLTANQVLGGLQVQPLVETEVLQIVYTSPDPAFAKHAADSFAENYISYRRHEAIKELLAAQASIQHQIDNTTQQISELDQKIEEADPKDKNLLAVLGTQRNALFGRLGLLQQRLDDVQPDRSIRLGGGKVIAPATLPRAPSSPNYLLNFITTGLLGLAVGIALAFVRERLDDRVKDHASLETTLKVPVLSTIPKFSTRGKKRTRLIVKDEPHGAPTEAFRSLRTNIEFLAGQQAIKSLLITSPAASEGKTTTSANLAVTLAQAGRRVIVISADLRRPMLEHFFDLDGARPGLTDVLTGAWPPPLEILHDPGVENLRILPTGTPPHNPAELITSPLMPQLLRTLEGFCDLLLIDSAPVLAVADATVLASNVSAVVLVVNSMSTKRSAAVRAAEELQRVGGRLVGAVLNGVESDRSSYYYGAYAPTNGEASNGGGKARKGSVVQRS